MYSEQRSGLAVPLLSATVLVVEDEPLLRLAIVADLEEEGFTVFEASGAAEAIGILEKHSDIRLLFTDIDMPGTMDGLRLAAFVRDRWPPIKIIVTSGHRFPEIGQLPTDTPFMRKPYAAKDVASAIRLLTGE